MRLLTTFTLLTIGLNAIGQTPSTKQSDWIHTESRYTDSTGKRITIQNSFPKGGGQYTDSAGRTFSYVIFWNRVVNESAVPLQLTVNFPADSFPVPNSPGSYLKVFLFPGTMTPGKILMPDYGFTGLKSFLDTGFNKPTLLQKAIKPKEELFFYIGMLFYTASGSTRTALILKEQNLFYTINLLDSALIPCGQVVFKK